MSSLKILIIVTSHAVMGNTEEPTGLWLEELTTPYYAFIDAGLSVSIASIDGGAIPIDPRSQKSIGENAASVDRFLQDQSAMAEVKNTPGVNNVDPEQYDAIFLPGGHGTMWDLPQSQPLATVISQVYAQEKVVAAVCHGPAGLINATKPDGSPLVAGHKISAFTNSEEDAVGLSDTVPFMLESKLRELGANFHGVDDFQPFVVESGNLITGQNPSSSLLVAKKVLEALQVKVS
ncbi:type 1 glutamine amidotransferase domain-containing protein [Pleurocapsa sp. PCC 7319]|uniref:type 1 glutamine amidotransferase domain-containing protein n=1 Tax=Pleurocapsa sp. PCC 7319 TaxID=118161 RepID=UPI00034B996B|nr:type 1 glutamine amidotransferase domain-containing protein [Pleurocapsa sp. PCC 7319]